MCRRGSLESVVRRRRLGSHSASIRPGFFQTQAHPDGTRERSPVHCSLRTPSVYVHLWGGQTGLLLGSRDKHGGQEIFRTHRGRVFACAAPAVGRAVLCRPRQYMSCVGHENQALGALPLWSQRCRSEYRHTGGGAASHHWEHGSHSEAMGSRGRQVLGRAHPPQEGGSLDRMQHKGTFLRERGSRWHPEVGRGRRASGEDIRGTRRNRAFGGDERRRGSRLCWRRRGAAILGLQDGILLPVGEGAAPGRVFGFRVGRIRARV